MRMLYVTDERGFFPPYENDIVINVSKRPNGELSGIVSTGSSVIHPESGMEVTSWTRPFSSMNDLVAHVEDVQKANGVTIVDYAPSLREYR